MTSSGDFERNVFTRASSGNDNGWSSSSVDECFDNRRRAGRWVQRSLSSAGQCTSNGDCSFTFPCNPTASWMIVRLAFLSSIGFVPRNVLGALPASQSRSSTRSCGLLPLVLLLCFAMDVVIGIFPARCAAGLGLPEVDARKKPEGAPCCCLRGRRVLGVEG